MLGADQLGVPAGLSGVALLSRLTAHVFDGSSSDDRCFFHVLYAGANAKTQMNVAMRTSQEPETTPASKAAMQCSRASCPAHG